MNRLILLVESRIRGDVYVRFGGELPKTHRSNTAGRWMLSLPLAAFEKYESTTKAVVANREAHRYALEKYMAGKSAVYEYNEIKMKLADALSQQSQAKYTYLLKERILAFYSCHSLADLEIVLN